MKIEMKRENDTIRFYYEYFDAKTNKIKPRTIGTLKGDTLSVPNIQLWHCTEKDDDATISPSYDMLVAAANAGAKCLEVKSIRGALIVGTKEHKEIPSFIKCPYYYDLHYLLNSNFPETNTARVKGRDNYKYEKQLRISICKDNTVHRANILCKDNPISAFVQRVIRAIQANIKKEGLPLDEVMREIKNKL